jgi:hypothetical protein
MAHGDDETYKAAVNCLAELGRRAWRLLFHNTNSTESLNSIGAYLKELGLSVGSIVQVVLKESLAEFVFPWALLCDKDNQSNIADWRHFWGARYQIEQYVGRSAAVRPLQAMDVDFAFLPWDSFKEAGKVRAKLTAIASPPRIESVGECTTDEALIDTIRNDRANFYCFFCHGHTRKPYDPAFGDLIQRQLAIIKAKKGGSIGSRIQRCT